MATLLATSTGYIQALENYIKGNQTVEQNRVLAVAYREDRINHACQLFKYGCLELRHARTSESYQTHSEALQSALNIFLGSYSQTLTKEQEKAIEQGYKAMVEPSQSNRMPLRP